ncbi:hypothetical protein GIB67_010197 [Kingdonia uniflora]|uniref:Derlin n=1 Tax=Kingdonia uniflora TaxID=39325 RepID=A0A7J7NAQ7_9MAGN|nr:hypothetical protein GIB67_010197 [Kingdonia uniflora]
MMTYPALVDETRRRHLPKKRIDRLVIGPGVMRSSRPRITKTFQLHKLFLVYYTRPRVVLNGGFYNSLPPISKAYGTACLLATTALQFELYNPENVALVYSLVFTRFQVWRLFLNFFVLGKFSINFGIRLLMIARYGVQLEKGPFERRSADFLWMMLFGALSLLALSAIPFFWSPHLGISLVFMLLYVWSREFPTAQVNIYGLVSLKAFYLPWAMLALDVIFGSRIMPDLLGIIAGHLYYFLTVLYPLSSGKHILKTPNWVHKLVLQWGHAYQATGRPVQPERAADVAFRGRSYRLNSD